MILVDIDVLIDVALDRQPHSEPASELLDLIERGVETASIAWHSVSNLYYIVNPTRGDIVTREFIREFEYRLPTPTPNPSATLRDFRWPTSKTPCK